MIKEFLNHVKRIIFGRKESSYRDFRKELYFKNVRQVNFTPNLDDVNDRELVHVFYNGKSYWVLFKCPCGCGVVISLPLINYEDRICWSLKINKDGSPSLYPSIWQNKGCYSHFWIEKGVIEWCFNQ